MAYKIVFKRSAEKELKKLNQGAYPALRSAIDKLAAKPHPHQSVKLVGSSSLWRLRVGDYRVIYDIQGDKLVIYIIKVGHRREVYRK
jgi:mRNA interferase RelE/StbE